MAAAILLFANKPVAAALSSRANNCGLCFRMETACPQAVEITATFSRHEGVPAPTLESRPHVLRRVVIDLRRLPNSGRLVHVIRSVARHSLCLRVVNHDRLLCLR